MGVDLRSQLADAYPEHNHKLLFYALGRTRPDYNDLSVQDTFAKFKTDFLPLCPLTDKLGRKIQIAKVNFRKLINLKHKALGDDARARKIIEELETRAFDLANYEAIEQDRIRTLFWVPEVIEDPDAIYKNNHRVVKADEVFVCVYDKPGSRVKLAFTSTFGSGDNKRIEIVTSYLTDAKTAMYCAKGKPLYEKQKCHP
jgi:hypothetical protein